MMNFGPIPAPATPCRLPPAPAHRQVRADGTVHRHEGQLHRLGQRRVEAKISVQDGLAVFVLADLQEWRVRRRLDEVAGGIDQEQPRWLGADLAAHQQAAIEADILLRQRLTILFIDRPHRGADQTGRLKHRRNILQLGEPAIQRNPFLQMPPDGLGDREVAGGAQAEHPFAGHFDMLQFGEDGDVVHACIGAGVTQQQQAFAQAETDAIGHAGAPPRAGRWPISPPPGCRRRRSPRPASPPVRSCG